VAWRGVIVVGAAWWLFWQLPGPVTAGQGYPLPLVVGRHASVWRLLAGRVEHDDDALRVWGGSTVVLSDYEHGRCMLELDYRQLGPCAAEPILLVGAEERAGRVLVADEAVSLARPADRLRHGVLGRRAHLAGRSGVWQRVRIELGADGGGDGRLVLRVAGDVASSLAIARLRVWERDFSPLFDGQSLAGWTGAGEDAATCWRVADGLLECTGQRGPWLRSMREYGDFALRLEYRLLPGGNSGVYVRVPADGNHHGPGAGLEVQILDDHAERYRDLQPYQFTGSLYAIAPARPGSTRPAGDWNSLEIRCTGLQYTVVHNGQLVVEASARDCAELAERRVRGFLGLQNHSERVEFRHVRIRAAD
jgi:hypothetical protein